MKNLALFLTVAAASPLPFDFGDFIDSAKENVGDLVDSAQEWVSDFDFPDIIPEPAPTPEIEFPPTEINEDDIELLPEITDLDEEDENASAEFEQVPIEEDEPEPAPEPEAPAQETGMACNVPAGSGTCLSVSNDGCSGGTFHPGTAAPWPCPGDEDIQCCVIEAAPEPAPEPEPEAPAPEPEAPQQETGMSCSVPAGSGTCLSVSNDGCDGGSFHPGTGEPWPCPGDNDIQCCVKGSSEPSEPSEPAPAPPSGGLPGGNGHIDQESIDHLKALEGWVPGVYDDPTGIATIGYGHNCEAHPGTCEKLSIPLSKEDGEKLMIDDLRSFESCVCDLPNAAQLNTKQFGALVSFAYNSGCGGVENYWLSDMQNADFAGICDRLPSTNTLDGLLTSRRTQEQTLCRTATSVMSGC